MKSHGEELLRLEQLHFTAFQGNNSPKCQQFDAFLSDIRAFLLERIERSEKVFFSYAWPKEEDDHNEFWHTDFIRGFHDHLVKMGVVASLDQIESVVAHNLNAFMQRIEQSHRVFLFRSKTLDEKLTWDASGAKHENNLITACEVAKSVNKPFVLNIALNSKCKPQPDSFTRKNIPETTDYLMLLKSVIAETYGLGEEFEQYWQERLIAHKIMDFLVKVPAQAPNMVRREELLSKLDKALESSDPVLCVGDAKSGKKQLCLSYIWDNYYRYREVYWLRASEAIHVQLKPNSLVFLLSSDNFDDIRSLMSRKDVSTKVVIILNNVRILPAHYREKFENIIVDDLLPQEAHALIENILGETVSSERELLFGITGLRPEPLLLACGYIQRNRITISEYLEHLKESPAEVAKFVLRPIRERKRGLGLHNSQDESCPPRLKRRAKPEEYSYKDVDAILQVAPPKPDDPKREQKYFESQQSFSCHPGQVRFLGDIRFELDKLVLPQKTIFISFALPSDNNPDEKWTEVFVKSLAEHFQRVGVTVYFMDDKNSENLEDYVSAHQDQLRDIHVFVISTRGRLNNSATSEHDEMIKRCWKKFPELKKDNQRFMMPICLTSEKHYDKDFKLFGAYWFYGHEYLRQLKDLMGFMFWLDESFHNFWRECELKHELASNWWPSRPAENPHFVGREVALRDMQKHFRSSDKLLVISANGMGGVGKTQLAQRFGQLYGHTYTHIFVLNAGSRDALLQSYVALGIDKNLFYGIDKNMAIEDRVKIVINWLENGSTGWLLIVDNATNFDEVDGWLPAKGGQVLVTSRHKEWPGQHNISVELFTPEEAREYFVKVLGRERVGQESHAVDELIEIIGPHPLPLVVAQVCAYIRNNSITIAEYIELYKSKKLELLGDDVQQTGEEHNAVKVTWNMTFSLIQREYPACSQVMNICSWFYHEDIPVPWIESFFGNRIILLNAIRTGIEYSMLNFNRESNLLSVHALVQESVRHNLTMQEVDESSRFVIESLRKHVPYQKLAKTSKQIRWMWFLIPHLESVSSLMVGNEEDLRFLLERLRFVYNVVGALLKQKEVLLRLLTIETRLAGPKSIDVGNCLYNIAGVFRELNDIMEAWAYLFKARQIYEDHYEEDSLETASVDILEASILSREGKHKLAKKYLKRAIAIKEKKLGKDDVSVMETLINLSHVYAKSKKHTKQREIIEDRVLPILIKKVGEHHESVAMAYASLATAYGGLGDLQNEQTFIRRALAIDEVNFGKQHPYLVDSLRCIAEVCGKTGDVLGQKEHLERALLIIKRSYGENNVELPWVLISLADVYKKLNDLPAARSLLVYAERVTTYVFLEKQKGTIDDVIKTFQNLALAYGELDELHKKAELLEILLGLVEIDNKENYSDIFGVLNALIQVYAEVKNVPKQCEFLERKLKLIEQLFSSEHSAEHPQALQLLAQLSQLYAKDGKIEKAIEYTARIYRTHLHDPRLGPDHPMTLSMASILVKLKAHPPIRMQRLLAHHKTPPVESIEELNRKGRVSYEEGDYPTALEFYEDCMSKFVGEGRSHHDPFFPLLNFNIGITFAKLKNHQGALLHLNRAQAFYEARGNTACVEKTKRRIAKFLNSVDKAKVSPPVSSSQSFFPPNRVESRPLALNVELKQAHKLLLNHIMEVRDILKPAVEECLLTQEFIEFLDEQAHGLRVVYIAFREATAQCNPQLSEYENRLKRYADDLNVLSAYLNYVFVHKCTKVNEAHPCILKALKAIASQKFNSRVVDKTVLGAGM